MSITKEQALKIIMLANENETRADLQGANLQRANLQEANLRWANLRGADLQEANLRWANLRGADLQDANLRGADLQDANLQDANLRGADLQDANLQEANLQGANLDFACWPLHCGSFNLGKTDDRLVSQLLQHLLHAAIADKSEYGQKVVTALKPLQKFHEFRSDIEKVE